MAVLVEFTAEQETALNDWIASRPPAVRALAERFRPNRLYQMKSTGHRVTVHSFSEDGTMTVNVGGRFNAVLFERRVFGITPDDLEECDIPCIDEPVGVFLDDAQTIGFINMKRAENNLSPLSFDDVWPKKERL